MSFDSPANSHQLRPSKLLFEPRIAFALPLAKSYSWPTVDPAGPAASMKILSPLGEISTDHAPSRWANMFASWVIVLVGAEASGAAAVADSNK